MSDPADNLPTDEELNAAADELSRAMMINGMGMLHALYLREGPSVAARDVVASVWCAMRATQMHMGGVVVKPRRGRGKGKGSVH